MPDPDDYWPSGRKNIMAIPLPLEHYVQTAIGPPLRSRRWSEDEKNTIGWCLTDRARSVVEGDHVPARLNRNYSLDYINGVGVCLLAPDHSFGRGVIRLLLGWTLIVCVPNDKADEFDERLRKEAKGQFVRSMLYSKPMTAFSLEDDRDMEIAVAAKMEYDGVNIVHSKLPLSSSVRFDYILNDG